MEEYSPNPWPPKSYTLNIGGDVGVGRSEKIRACLRTSKQILEPEHWEQPIPGDFVSSGSSQSVNDESDKILGDV